MMSSPYEGRGCHHCQVGIPITYVASPAGVVKLCLECTKVSTGRDVLWFEERHSPCRDHVGDALVAAYEAQKRAGLSAVKTAVKL